MPRLFYLVLLGGFVVSTAHATTRATPDQPARAHTAPASLNTLGAATDALNAQSLARAQRAQPVRPVAPIILPEGTIAKGTGVLAPELLEAPVYNPADRR